MPNKYTRQRQGRDFSILDCLRSAARRPESSRHDVSWDGSFDSIDGITGNSEPNDDAEKKKSLLERMAQYNTETERNSVPVDGHEPSEMGR